MMPDYFRMMMDAEAEANRRHRQSTCWACGGRDGRHLDRCPEYDPPEDPTDLDDEEFARWIEAARARNRRNG